MWRVVVAGILMCAVAVGYSQTRAASPSALRAASEPAYRAEMGALLADGAANSDAFLGLLRRSRDGESAAVLMPDLADLLAASQARNERAASLEPPPRFVAPHALMVEAWRMSHDGLALSIVGIAERDIAALNDGTEMIRRANVLLDAAVELLAGID